MFIATYPLTKLLFFRFVILAGDVSPIDVISHFPVLCEDNNLPYCYVPSRLVSSQSDILGKHICPRFQGGVHNSSHSCRYAPKSSFGSD